MRTGLAHLQRRLLDVVLQRILPRLIIVAHERAARMRTAPRPSRPREIMRRRRRPDTLRRPPRKP